MLYYLSARINQLLNLKRLHALNNQLEVFPENFCQQGKLEFIHVSNNYLSGLPQEIAQLKSLRGLKVDHNQLTSLPEGIGHLSQLHYLNASHNHLTTLPKSLITRAESGQMKGLFLHGNEELGIPDEVLGPTDEECLASRLQLKNVPIEMRHKIKLVEPTDPEIIAAYWRQR